MSDVSAKANQAQRLAENEDFRALLAAMQEDAVRLFLAANGDNDTISRASDLVRAVRQIESALNSRIDAEKIEEKRKAKHRAND